MSTQLFFSNSIESLTKTLADEIAHAGDPFEPLTIIVPNPHLQKWIQLKIAEYHGISMNLTFRFLNDGLWELLNYQNPDSEKPSALEQQDMHLLLYHAMSAIDPGNDHLQLLEQYLFNDDNSKKSDYDHKIFQLSSRLARYFMEYELYRHDMIQSWIKGTLHLNNEMESAQRYLYRTLFAKGGYRDSVQKNWFTLPQYWNFLSSKPANPRPRSLILFGESHLSPLHAAMIFEMGNKHAISVYQVNPCSEFWEDVTTPREDRWQRIRSTRIEETPAGATLNYDENENPLLKLWGKTGRETIKLLSLIEEAGSRDEHCTSEWIISGRTKPANTALSIVQDHILRRSTWHDPGARISQDTSIQIASCPELYREAESVFNSILYNLECDSTLRMTDIAVMVPDMAVYGPVLHSVFSRKPRRLSYSIIDSTAVSDSLFAKAVLSLIEIAAGFFTRTEIFGLFRNPCFYEAHSMTLDDVLAWLSWAHTLNIFRSFHKTDKPDPEQNLFTWHQGLLRLRFGRIMDAKASSVHEGRFIDYKNIVPYSDINTGDQNLMNNLSSLIELLHVKTDRLCSLEAPPAEWIKRINDLIGEFLTIPKDKPEEARVYNSLMDDLNRLAILDRLPGTNKPSMLSIAAIKEFIIDTLTGITSSRGSYLTSGINISALVPKRQIPFRIIYIMGMQEGIFPGTSDISTLNLMTFTRKIGDATRPDVNRYHFLETFLAAREKLYITYISKDIQKDQDFNPNSVIGQLITYLNNYVIKDNFIIPDVPPSGSSIDYLRHDPAKAGYFDIIQAPLHGSYNPVNYCGSDRLVMLNKLSRIYSLNKETAAILSERLNVVIPDFSIPATAETGQLEPASVSLNDLRYFLLNPGESALRWHLSMYDTESEDSSIGETEPFFSVYPSNYAFIINSLNYALTSKNAADLQTYMNYYYRHLRLMSVTPDGAYGDIDSDALQSDVVARFHDGEGLLEFILARNNDQCFQAISVGPVHSRIMPDKAFPPVVCPVNQRGNVHPVELRGSLPVLWKNPEAGSSETMVMTNSSKPSVAHVILPFLFYVIAVSNYNADLCDCIGAGPFTIHVSHQKGISSYSYQLSESESRQYLQCLLVDFLDTEHFDLLPLPILGNKRLIQPPDMKEQPDENEIIEYHQTLIDLIEDDAEKMTPAYRPMALLGLVEPEVPADAYIKVRNRFGIIFKPFTGGNHRDE